MFNDVINESMLCEIVNTITKAFDVNSNIIIWMTLIFDVDARLVKLLDDH